jgi:hypothetical protein
VKNQHTPQNRSLRFLHFLESITPKNLVEDQNQSIETRARVACMVGILGFSVLLPLLIIVTYLVLNLIVEINITKNIAVLLGVEIWMISQMLYFQSYGNLRITASAYSIQYFAVNGIFIVLSGGWSSSPIMIMILCSPMIAFMTVSARAALWYIVAVFLFCLGLLLCHQHEIPLPDISQPKNYQFTRFVALSSFLVILSLFVMMCDQLITSFHSKG